MKNKCLMDEMFIVGPILQAKNEFFDSSIKKYSFELLVQEIVKHSLILCIHRQYVLLILLIDFWHNLEDFDIQYNFPHQS